MNKLSEKARGLLVAGMNKEIRSHTTVEKRLQVAYTFKSLLFELKIYRGFQYEDWSNGGSSNWIKDGEPENKTPYLGDQSKIYFL